MLECWGTPVFDLAIRLYIASVFLRSGMLKLADWDTTRTLFESVYVVPLLPPAWAAVLGTMGETGLPILLVLGLATRFGAAGLSVVNFVAAISFPDISDTGLQDHWLWGSLLLVTVFHGAGTLSLDAWWAKWRLRGHGPGEAGSPGTIRSRL
ncbi:MAG: DoxX family protein [Proteobacteria bacterium]|nr:DoxX family protein [Pseudomonadota bacterium]